MKRQIKAIAVAVVDIQEEVRDKIEQFSPVSQFLNSQCSTAGSMILYVFLFACVCMFKCTTRMFLHVFNG